MTSIGDTGYWLVHSCNVGDLCADGCDGVLVWAENRWRALRRAYHKVECGEQARCEGRRPEADPFRATLGDLFGNGYGPAGDAQNRVMRQLGYRDPGASWCESCELYEWSEIPESAVCEECSTCRECGCEHER